MKISMTARRFELSDALRKYVEDRLSGLSRYNLRMTRVEVTLTEEKREKRAEARAAVDGDVNIHAEATADDFRIAVDRLSDKLARQLKRRRDRRTDHQAPRLGEEIPSQGAAEGGEQ
ncbi:MAG: ribosome-associated translation inhibitor RaiA [Gemmatimonadota bacterium]|nr:MAG: ribosome-associated translation inhibitor RaiA [Gemmatimonadota bacterium]